jgi:hypothetical protein
MKLRDHPLMARQSGHITWPPRWQPVGNHSGFVQAELGILEDVSMTDLIPNKVFIAMRHLGERYISVLQFDDQIFTRQIYSLLERRIGVSIREIGELELSHTL